MTITDETNHKIRPWVQDIPADWSTCRLSNVADILFSNVDKHALENEIPVRLCNYTDVYNNERITSGMDFMEATASSGEIGRFQLQKNDVIATKDSESWDDIAIAARVDDDIPGVLCGYHLAVVRSRSKRISGEYLGWLYQSKQFRAQYEAKATGVTRFGLGQSSFRETVIPLPNNPEQHRIATYLDNACEAIDGAIEAKQKQLESLADLRKSIIHKAVTRGLDDSVELKDSGVDWLGKIPRHWRKAKLRYEVSIGNGAFVSDSFDAEGEIPVFGGNGTMGKTNKFNLDGSAVIVGRVGAHCGNAHFVSGKVWVSDNALILETAHNECFLKFLLQAYNLNTLARKTAQPLITGTQIKGLYVGMPSHDEQTEIAQHIVKQENSISAIMSNIKHQIQTLSDYRKSLIHECVTGQRRIMEADIKKAKTSKTKAKSK